MPTEALTVQRTAELLGVSAKTVYRLVRAGQLPSIRLGAAVRIPRRQLQTWIDEQAERSMRPAITHEGPRRRRRAAPAGVRPQQVRRIM